MRDLGDLADPTKYHEPIDIQGQPTSAMRAHLRMMVTIRMVEQHLGEMRKEGLIGGPVHLGVGQEAIAVGVSACLRKSDRVFGTHRSHSHVLALGSSIHGLLAETLGKDTGLSRGMGRVDAPLGRGARILRLSAHCRWHGTYCRWCGACGKADGYGRHSGELSR